MGNCLCKDTPELDSYGSTSHTETQNTIIPEPNLNTVPSSGAARSSFKFSSFSYIDKLVLQTLKSLDTLVDK